MPDKLVLQVLLGLALIFTLGFALRTFVEKGSSRDKFYLILLAPVVGSGISIALVLAYYSLAFALHFGYIVIPVIVVAIAVFGIVLARRYVREKCEFDQANRL